MLPNPQPYFADLPDPRRETKNKLHKLQDMLMITFCAQLSGIDDWVGMEVFAQEREGWLRGFLELPNGIASHDTLSEVMGRLNPAAFRQAVLTWVKVALPSLAGQHVAVDGKTLRGAGDDAGPVPLISAFVSQAQWVLAQLPVADKSNEIKAIPPLLAMLDLRGATVSIDAMGCQNAIAEQSIDGGGNYVLALQANPPQLHEDVQLWLDTAFESGQVERLETLDKDHGRLEIRRYALSAQREWLEARAPWAGLQALGLVESQREDNNGKVSVERRYSLCSKPDLEHFAQSVRAHWSIENQQHWVLDGQFGEDHNRTRTDHAPENLALIRRCALNLLRQNGKTGESIKRRRLRAALNDDYRWQLLAGVAT